MRCVLGLGKKVLVGDDKVRERALAESEARKRSLVPTLWVC